MRKVLYLAFFFAVVLCACGESKTSDSFTTQISIPLISGETISGTRYGKGTTAVIISNMSTNDTSEWGIVPTTLANEGYIVYTYTYLGNYMANIQAVIDWAKQHGAKKYVLIGASLGGLISLKAAINTKVDALISISPPLSYPSISRLSANEAKTITAPKLMVYAQKDPDVGKAPSDIYTLLSEPKEQKVYEGDVHGTYLFNAHNDLLPLISKFLQDHVSKA
jgi:esterase/lipase